MRWLVGWSSSAAGVPGGPYGGTYGNGSGNGGGNGSGYGSAYGDTYGGTGAYGTGSGAYGTGAGPAAGETVRPVGAQLLWGDPDPLWAVGDWRPDEVRVIHGDSDNKLAVLGHCGASDEELRIGLFATRGGAFRHLTAWPGSYTAVACVGRRITIPTDLAGVRPVFHTPWAGGNAYATAALPLADLVEAQLDISHLAALLACPDAPEALGDGTPYAGVRRVPPGHALILRDGSSREIAGYEQAASLVLSAPAPVDADTAVAGVRDALVEAVRARLSAPRHADEGALRDIADRLDPGPVPGMGPAERRAARGGRPGPAPGIGADLSGGPASATLALLAAGLPGMPGTVVGTGDTEAGERLLAVTFNDLTAAATSGAAPAAPGDYEAELERARAIAENPRLHHVVVTGGDEALPYADLESGPLTDEPGPSLVAAERHRLRLSAGSADHLVGLGARQVLDAHPARLADLLLDRRRRHLLRPAGALARAEGAERGYAGGRALLAPLTVYRAARKLARTSYREGVEEAAARLRERRFTEAYGDPYDGTGGMGGGADGPTALDASLAALTWCRPGPAARWMTGEALAEVSLRLEAAAVARPLDATRPGERRARAALARQAADQRVLEQAAEIRNQRLHAPFYDNQVVRACRALPEAARVKPGHRAQVLRAVLAGAGVHDLPQGWGAPSHASQTASARAGLRVAVGPLLDLFEAPLLADAGLIEARVVRKALRAAADGEPLPLDGLADLVSTEVWLRRLLARRGTCWTGSAAPRQRAAAGGVTPAQERPAL
ncbi:asparagine synthase [Streptomyces armeniacus]|uniref:Asparagine synthase n=1 Tax=Streptomyces armeniacus TaxID=83291 RepID=A0A345XTY7_9ACTN|nr:asparagine synthase-related protein [Streptomyces armeniacus]AXK35103.1 asparagine synthase [Streptomyces armeniacus]